MSIEPVPSSSPPHAAFESRDVAWAPVLWTTGVSTVVILGLIAVVAAMYVALGGPKPAARLPPAPPVANLAQQLQKLRADEEERLNSYGWVSKQDGIGRIPIDRAIDLWLSEQSKP